MAHAEEATRTLQLAAGKARMRWWRKKYSSRMHNGTNQIIDQARMDAENIKSGADQYALDALMGLQTELEHPEHPSSKWGAGAAPEKDTTGTSDPTKINKKRPRIPAEAFFTEINPRRVLRGDITDVTDDHHHFALDLKGFSLVDHDGFMVGLAGWSR